MKKNNLANSIIKTLCYSQIFSYPLTISELRKYLIHNKKVTREEICLELYKNRMFFVETAQYIVLPGDLKLVRERNDRTNYSRKKLAKALWIASLLGCFPLIKMIGISGSLSMYNAKKNDDIDLFFITSRNFLWTTRFIVNILLLTLGEKRDRRERFVKDKICPNMFISEDHLEISSDKRNLYMAHEIAQLKVLYSRDNASNKFLQKNRWVLKYLPNAYERKRIDVEKKNGSGKFEIIKIIIEFVFFKIQYFYMKRKITNEKIGENFALFHPINQKNIVEQLFHLKVKTYSGLFKDQQKKENYSLVSALN